MKTPLTKLNGSNVILSGTIEIRGHEFERWTIKQDGELFFITSSHGYNGFEGKGDVTLDGALAKVQRLIKISIEDAE